MKGLWSVMWLLLLLLFGWWIGLLCGTLYVLLIPFTACIPELTKITDVFLKGENIPFHVANFMINDTPVKEASASE